MDIPSCTAHNSSICHNWLWLFIVIWLAIVVIVDYRYDSSTDDRLPIDIINELELGESGLIDKMGTRLWVPGGVLAWLEQVMLQVVLVLLLRGPISHIGLRVYMMLRVILHTWFPWVMGWLLDWVLLVSELRLLPLRLRVTTREGWLILNTGEICKVSIFVCRIWESQASNRLLFTS